MCFVVLQGEGVFAITWLQSACDDAHVCLLGPAAQLMGRQLFIRPFRTEVDALKRRFPEAAAEAARALKDLAAQGPPWGRGPPPHLRGPPPHMRGGSPPPFRDRSPPPFRDRSPSPFRGGSPPPFRGRSPPRVVEERGRKRARSGGRSMSPGRRSARSVSPDAILAPVLVDHFLQRGGQREWMLTGREVQVTGLRDSRDDAAVWQQVMPLVAAAGGTGAGSWRRWSRVQGCRFVVELCPWPAAEL